MALYAQYNSMPEADVASRSLNQNADDTYYEALGHYNNGEYETALMLFNEIPEGSPTEDELYLYKGYTEMQLGDFQTAIQSFSHLLSDATLQHEGLWYTGLAYLGLENVSEARSILNEFLAKDGQYKKEEARKLLRSL
jgi:tetratricopeptide (TPR) repeat protein